jgi:DNA primase
MQNQISSHSQLNFSNKIESTLLQILKDANVDIQSHSGNELNIYCPFHKNTNSPAFYINIKTGLWQCFNPSCGKTGNFRQFYKKITGKAYNKEFDIDPRNLQKDLDRGLDDEYGNYASNKIDISDIQIDYDKDISLLEPLISRGFTKETLRYFEIGFSAKKSRIVIPVRDANFKLVAFIGRAVDSEQDPRYLYSKGFKRADILFNLNNAKSFDSVIVCEGSLDAIKVHQAGFPNVVATLGAKVSDNQFSLLKKYFDSILIFSDNDEAGKRMAHDILVSCRKGSMDSANT